MERNDAINRLRKASVSYALWSGIADDGIVGPLTADVEYSAALAFRNAIKGAHESGLSTDEIAREALVPYSTVLGITR